MEKVSIVIPMHNSSNYIKQCIESVINQTYKNIEIIIVDDKSTDNGIEIIKKYNDERIRVIELKKNVGPAIARNIGIRKSTGEYICFLDSDDYWYIDKIEKQMNFINLKKCEFIFSGYVFFKNNEQKSIVHVPEKINYEEALKNTTIFTSTVMFNMNILKKKDIYMPNIKKGQDTATWWKVLKKGITAYGLDEVLSIYRVGNKSVSSNKIKALKRTWKLYEREKISFFKKVYCFSWYVIHAIKRRMG